MSVMLTSDGFEFSLELIFVSKSLNLPCVAAVWGSQFLSDFSAVWAIEYWKQKIDRGNLFTRPWWRGVENILIVIISSVIWGPRFNSRREASYKDQSTYNC